MRIGPAVATALLLAAASPASAAECPPGEGTTVVVDFAELGGGVAVGCAPTAATGFQALAEAGFAVDTVQENPAFVCRIDGRPGADREDCVDTPPASAFWSYWSADRGGDWRFSTTGASAPIEGELEGWAFATGGASPPRYDVPAPITTTTSTSSTSSTTSTTTSTTPATTTSLSPPTSAATTTTTTTTAPLARASTIAPSTTAPSTTASSTTAPSTTAPSTTASASTATSGPPATLSPAPTISAAAEDSEGAGGFLAGAGVLAAIGLASWAVARRRFGGGGT